MLILLYLKDKDTVNRAGEGLRPSYYINTSLG